MAKKRRRKSGAAGQVRHAWNVTSRNASWGMMWFALGLLALSVGLLHEMRGQPGDDRTWRLLWASQQRAEIRAMFVLLAAALVLSVLSWLRPAWQRVFLVIGWLSFSIVVGVWYWPRFYACMDLLWWRLTT